MAHPLTSILQDAMSCATDGGHIDPIQGSVRIHLSDGTALTGHVTWVEEDGEVFDFTRLLSDVDLADTPQHIVTAYVTRIYYHQAGA